MTDEQRCRFLQPGYAAPQAITDAIVGHADTPAADAICELYIKVDERRIVDMCFALYGPPVAVACADWLCEYATGRTIESLRGLSAQDIQAALVLAPEERFGAMLVLDALNNAVAQMQV